MSAAVAAFALLACLAAAPASAAPSASRVTPAPSSDAATPASATPVATADGGPFAAATCTRTITASASAGGSITPSGSVVLACGDLQQFEIASEPCYTISNVIVDGVSQGPLTSYQFLLVSDNHTILASFTRISFPIMSSAGSGGTISPKGIVQVTCGSSQIYSVTPNPCYAVDQLLVDGNSVGPVTLYTFRNISTDHTIEASFSPLTYHVMALAGAGGSIAPGGNVVVNCGANASFTVAPGACYSIGDVMVDGVSRGALTGYAFTNVHADHTIQAQFNTLGYTVTATAGAGGSISPAGPVAVPCGTDRSFSVAADACHTLLDVRVDGVSKGPIASYTMLNVRQPHTIDASFALRTFGFTADAGPGGSISPAGASVVGCGATVVFEITPAPCQRIADVWVDGVSVGPVANYTFSAVDAAHAIVASFAPNDFTVLAGADPGGGIDPAGTIPVSCGGGATFTIHADACRAIRDVEVDGVSIGPVASYTFNDVQSAHTIQAHFGYALDGPPVIAGLSASPASLAPADHTMRDVTIDYTVTDCSPVACVLSVACNEPGTGTSDGDAWPDWQVLDAHHLRLRAERAVGSQARIYAVTLTCVDSTGEQSTQMVAVVTALNIASPASGALVRVGNPVNVQGAFWDVAGPVHQATWTFDAASMPGAIVEPSGLSPGHATATYSPPAVGVYDVQLGISDNLGGSSTTNMGEDLREVVVAYDTTQGYAAGGGWYASAAGALASDPAATGKMGFGFVAKFARSPSHPGTPTGEVRLRMQQAGLEFVATSYSGCTISGSQIRLTGAGTTTGDPDPYTFMIVCVDDNIAGGGSDRLRIKLTNATSGAVVYDTQPGAVNTANPSLVVGGSASILMGYQGAAYTTDVPGHESAPVAFALEQNTPNPARGACRIRYALPAPSRVRLTLFDVTGRAVARLEDGERGAGAWSARVDDAKLPGGVYFYRLEASRLDGRGARFTQTRRMLLLR